MLVGLDEHGLVHDLYYPHVAQESHVGEFLLHRLGVYVDGKFSWLYDPGWHLDVRYEPETMASDITARNEHLGVELGISDVVYNEKNIYIRRIEVRVLHEGLELSGKVFFGQEFHIGEASRSDTVYFDPRSHSIIQYRGPFAFLMNVNSGDKKTFDEYTVGGKGYDGKEGSFRDAEDGMLSGNTVEHGPSDSVVGVEFHASSRQPALVHYWITAGNSVDEAWQLNSYIQRKTPEHLWQSTRDFWFAWLKHHEHEHDMFSPELWHQYHTSLLIVRAHTNHNGAVVASSDSGILKNGRDNYTYMWPRDGALVIESMIDAGYAQTVRNYFKFSNQIINADGYFGHKYTMDGNLASSWHSWMYEGKPALPIQEDETALTLLMLEKYFQATHDVDMIEKYYTSLIKGPANFMCAYVDDSTGLPLPSYDLWEEVYGCHTFTASATAGALQAAGKLANLLGKRADEEKFRRAGENLSEAIVKHLYDPELGMFLKGFKGHTHEKKRFDVLDMSSFYGAWRYGIIQVDSPIAQACAQTLYDRLQNPGKAGGFPRRADDYYFKTELPLSNPWILSTLWMAQFEIQRGNLEQAEDAMRWASYHALPSGALPEQIHPETGGPLSATPLTWSHAEYIKTMVMLLDAHNEQP